MNCCKVKITAICFLPQHLFTSSFVMATLRYFILFLFTLLLNRNKGDDMENTVEILDQDDVLSRIHQYELERDEERVFINVREPVGGSAKGSFIAVPSLISKECSNTDYVGLGDSVEDALKDCLKRIKGVPLGQVIPQG